MYDYAIRFERDDSAPGVAVFCRDLPELNSFGDDEAHAFAAAVDAIETTLSLYVDQRREIPAASAPEAGEHVVHLPAVTVAKIALWNEMMARGMRKADLCRLLGVAQAQGDRLVDFLHTSKIEQLEAALAALGLRLRVSYEALPNYVDYNITYLQDGKPATFSMKYNADVPPGYAWLAIVAYRKLSVPRDMDNPSYEDICRAHGVTDASIVKR